MREWPNLGCGIGLRTNHYDDILSQRPKVDWFEAITENFMDSGGKPILVLEEIRKHYTVALHGVSLSIGSVDPVNVKYLKKLKALVDRINPASVSDHLCWSGVGGAQLHDLLPLPFTLAAVQHVCNKVDQIQEFLKTRILLENPSMYITFKESVMTEWDFLNEVAKRTGCGILLDVNNIYVNAFNHNFSTAEYIDNISETHVAQFHLAGHTDMGTFLFDTHSKPVKADVWECYKRALARFGQRSTLVEWDEDIPPLAVLNEERFKARAIYDTYADTNRGPLTIPEPVGVNAKISSSALESLKNIQQNISSYIQPSHNGENISSIEAKIKEHLYIKNNERLAIYSEGYVTRIYEALAETYEATQHVIGKNAFFETVQSFAQKYPSRYYNLHYAGSTFPQYLASNKILLQYPFLSDLASLEWYVSESFHASLESVVLNWDRLAEVPQNRTGELQIIFKEGVYVLISKWPILDIWQSRKTPITEIAIEIANRPQNILVFRRESQVVCLPINLYEAEGCSLFREGASLEKVIEALIDRAPSEQLAIQQWMINWKKMGLIQDVRLEGKSIFAMSFVETQP